MARKKASLGCLFWTALVLLVVVVFLFNRTAIEGVLERTDLIAVLQRTFSGNPVEEEVADPEAGATAPPASGEPGDPDGHTSGQGSEPHVVEVPPAGSDAVLPVEQTATPTADPSDIQDDGRAEPATEAVVAADDPTPEPTDEGGRQRRARLYFVTVDDGGAISLHGLLRTIDYENAPLTATLTELLSGPASAELHQGYISLIPPGVELRRVAVHDSVATIDFSEQFRFNRLGQEGLLAQLQQIVFSATEFSTVSEVQILIDGEKVDYLGPEGMFVGTPIGRTSF